MNFKISSWAIRKPIFTIVLFIVLTVIGTLSFQRLPINADPSVSFPIVTVSVAQSGASPDEMEKSVTTRIENALAGMTGVRHITSTITDGASSTTVEFALGTDIDKSVNDVRNTIAQIRSNLPQSITEPVVERLDTEGGALINYVVQAPNMSPAELSWFIDDTVSRELLAVRGVQQVTRIGGAKREIHVALKPERLNALGITAEQVNAQLAQTNANIPAGRTISNAQEQSIRVLNSAQTLQQLADTPISLGGGRFVKLSELAAVRDSSEQVRDRARLNGKEVIGFNVLRSKGSSDTVVAEGVEQAVAKLAAENPDIKISIVHNSVENTRENYRVTMNTLLEGALLTVLVVMLFLRNWRATLVAALALPLSVLPTFFVMQLLGYTLNSITLLAIMLVIGILVDDAIVEIENIEQHLHMGKRPFQAAIDASDAIGLAVVAISGTIIAVFLPVSFISGVVGQYFSQFGVTVSAAVAASLLVARMATPLLAAYILKPLSHTQKQPAHDAPAQSNGKFLSLYLKLLDTALHWRKTTLAAGLGVLLLSALMVPLLPTGFVPQSDIGKSTVSITLPPSSTLSQTDEKLQQIATRLRRHKEVVNVYAEAGSSGEVYKGTLLVSLVPAKERELSQKEMEAKMRQDLAQFADIRFSFQNDFAQRDVSIVLTGSDPKALTQAAHTLKAQMQKISSIANVQLNEPLQKPELQVKLRQEEAARLGITPASVGNLLRIATVGDLESASAKFNLPDRQIPIRVLLNDVTKNDIEAIKRLAVPTAQGGSVPLASVADITLSQGSASLERFDRARRIAVEADLAPGRTIGEVLAEIDTLSVWKSLPAGVRKAETGDAEFMTEMFEQFALAMGFGIMMVLVVLILLFADFLQPLTILVALPLSIGGAVAGLLLTGSALDLASVIGILMLMGIVTKNSILLVDFVIEKRRHGIARQEALLQAGKERSRPIIMTTLAMVAGMVPAVFAGGSGDGFRAVMAITVISGLIASTLLSLVFVPVVYTLMDDLRGWMAPKLGRLTSVTQQDRDAAESHHQQ